MAPGEEIWHVRWQRGELLDPHQQPCAPVSSGSLDLEIARQQVDRWQEQLNLMRSMPRIGNSSYWWHTRFLLIHECLVRILPQLRVLLQIRELHPTPRFIQLHHPPERFWPELLQVVFPDSHITAPRPVRRGHLARLRTLPVRLWRAWATHGRLQRLAPPTPSRPRVLVISRDRTWNGNEDTELGTAIAALESQDFDVVHLSVAVHPEDRKRGWRTRPATHLFEDWIYLNFLRRHGRLAAPPLKLPDHGLEFDGIDLAPVAAAMLRSTYNRAYSQRGMACRGLPALLERVRPDVALLTDENGGSHGFKVGLMEAGIPIVAVQHGVIHDLHTSYVFPSGTEPSLIPLCDVTCVYGDFEREILVGRSIYPESCIAVTGQVQMDRRNLADRAWGERGEPGESLRKKILPPGCDGLLLFTSQETLRAASMPTLLRAFAASELRNYLVIRPHPQEHPEPFWKEAIESFQLHRRVLVSRQGPLEQWLDACDVHLSVTSTVLGEAAALGRPNIIVNAKRLGDLMGCLEAGMAVNLEDYSSLDDALRYWRSASPELSRQRFIEHHFHKLDGRAGERIAEVVESAVTTSTARG